MTATALVKAPSLVLKRTGDRYTWLEILQDLTNAQREAMMIAGTAPRFEDLVGWEFGGANSVPLFRLVGIRKFVKGFFDGPPRSRSGPEPYIQGYNLDVANNADDAGHVIKADVEGHSKPFGFYRVHRVVQGARDDRYPNALLLDYSLGGNGLFGPPLRDYLVQIYPDDPDLLLGKAYLNLLGVRIPTNYFVLKRLREHAFGG